MNQPSTPASEQDYCPEPTTLPAGRYWIGDPSYVTAPKDFGAANDPEADHGTPIVKFRTGDDGIFSDQYGRDYYVDSAHIAAVPERQVMPRHHPGQVSDPTNLGNYVDFPEPFHCNNQPMPGAYGRTLTFGHIVITVC